MDSSKNRDALVQKAFDNKLLIGACGEAGIRFRPSLNFTEQEAEKTLEILMKSVRELHG